MFFLPLRLFSTTFALFLSDMGSVTHVLNLPFDTISHIIYTNTNSSHISINHIQPHLFRYFFSFFNLIPITVLTASNFTFLITYPNHLSLFYLILSTVLTLPLCFPLQFIPYPIFSCQSSHLSKHSHFWYTHTILYYTVNHIELQTYTS